MPTEKFIKQTLEDVKIKVNELFEENFRKKAFFNEKWPTNKIANHRGSMMLRSGNLRASVIAPKLTPNGIVWSSSLPYADIHNKGGEITVTPQMKKYFWAMYYKTAGAMGKKKNGELRQNQRNNRLSMEAKQFKSFALMKVGTKIKIPKRQFIGHHPEIDKAIKEILNHNFEELQKNLINHRENK